MAKFKVELEVDVEYEKSEIIAIEPYTRLTGFVATKTLDDKIIYNNYVCLATSCGKIKDFNIKKFERIIKEEN